MEDIPILIAEDVQSVAEAYSTHLASSEGISVVGVAPDGATAIQLTLQRKPSVVLMDIAMPVMDGIEATKHIKARSPETKVLSLSERGEPEKLQGMYRAGADGLLHKNCGLCDIENAIRSVVRGGFYLCSGIDASILGDQAARTAPEELALKDKSILRLAAEGNTHEEIAELLGMKPSTVGTHLTRMLKKYGVRNTVALYKYAIDNGLL